MTMRELLIILTVWAVASAQGASLRDGLVAYWSLNETSGTRYDLFSTNHLTVNGPSDTIAFTGGVIGGGISNQYAGSGVTAIRTNFLVNTNFVMPTNEMTISTWVYRRSATNTVGTSFVTWADPAFENWGINFTLSCRSNQIGAVAYYGQESSHVSVQDLYLFTNTTNKWWHVVFSSSATQGAHRLFVNGVLRKEDIYDPAILTMNNAIALGGSSLGNSVFNGMIDDTAIWNRVLTSNEVSQIYADGTNGISSIANAISVPSAVGLLARQVVPSGYPTNSLTNGLILTRRINQ